MQRTASTLFVAGTLALFAAQTSRAQSAYFQAVTNLNPVGYWPLNETAQPPPPFSSGIVASNSGSAGIAGNGYYGAWYQPSSNTWFLTNNIIQTNGVTSANDGDAALLCKFQPGQYVIVPRATNGVTNSAVTIVPPFSVEAWVVPQTTAGNVGIIVGEGQGNLVYGGPNTNNPYYGGLGDPGWAGFVLGQYQNYLFFNYYMTNGTSKANELDSPHPTGGQAALLTNAWNHVVCTFDGNIETMWINGNQVGSLTHSKNAAGVTWAADLTTPLMIGSGNTVTAQGGGGGVAYTGAIDEVAIYNYVLGDANIQNHYMAGFGTNASGTPASYVSTIQGDAPTLYYRLDEPQTKTNAGYNSASYPVATNYGVLGAAANGAYQPGTTPGVAGPPYAGFGSSKAVALNGFFGAVDVGGGNLPAALNPVGPLPLTIVSWFQGNSADAPARYQDIVGHGNSSYRLALGTTAGENRFNPGATNGPELQFTSAADVATNHAAKNDGNWHMAAGVTDGTNAFLYLDGILYKSSNSVNGLNITGSPIDLLLGGDPQNSFASQSTGGTDRTFDGQIAQVAIWTNALSGSQLQSLFNAAGVPPSILLQPAGATNNQGTNLTISAVVPGSQPISFQWYDNGVAVAGQTNQTLSFPSVTTNNIGSYYLVATSAYGSVTSSVAPVFVYGAPAIQTLSQTNLAVYAGGNPVLSVTANGAQPITYQWFSNNVPVTSATSQIYTISNIQSSATYTAVLSNTAGTTTAGPVVITVLPRPSAPYPLAVLADHPLAFWRLDESNGVTAYDYWAGNNGIYTNVALSTYPPYSIASDPAEGYAPSFGTFSANNSYMDWVPTNINFTTPTNVNGEFSVECWIMALAAPNDGGILALGYGNGGEEFALDLGGNDPAHDLRFYVRDSAGIAHGATSTFAPAGDSKWHHVVGVCDESSGTVTLYIDGRSAATASIPLKGGILASSQSLSVGARQSGLNTIYDNQFIGGIDEVAVYNYALTASQVQAHFFSAGAAPLVTSVTPSNLTTNSGTTVTFTATAYGTPPLTFQWLSPNNTLVSTNSTLVLSNVQQSASGQYTLTVSNSSGTFTTNVNLTVNVGPPQEVQDIAPLTQTVALYSGLDNISYTFAVTGSQPFFYQWYQNGSPVAGATNSTYTFTAQAGTNTYYATVTNSFTATQGGGNPLRSSTATVIGVPAPQLTPGNFAHSLKISFPGFTGQPLTNFPALLTLSSATIPALDYSQFSGSNGSDLRFTDASGTAMLPYEIDEWNSNGVSTLWVDVPLLNGTNIWAYWGNANASTNPPPAPSNVWLNAGYEIVYHLKETNFPFADSTGQYPATNGVAPSPTNGVVSHAEEFNGSSDYISPGPVALSNQFTTYAWVYLNNGDTDIQTVWANAVGGYGANGFSWFVDSYQTADRVTHFDTGNGAGSGADPTGTAPVTSGAWHFMTAVWDIANSRVTNYLDAAVNGAAGAVSSMALTNNLDLGSFLNPIFWFNGAIDEARIQSGIASTNWILATYRNISQPSFVSYGSSGPMLTITATNGGFVISWPNTGGTFILQSTPSLSPPIAWNTAPGTPTLNNGIWQQTVPFTAGDSFYRLVQ
jgi:hypothetical protein